MTHGPNQAEVDAFIRTLPTLTLDQWNAARRFMVKRDPDLFAKLDEASLQVISALLNDPVLDRATTAAKELVIAQVDKMRWSDEDSWRQMKMSAIEAVGTIVALDHVDFEAVVVRFAPFRGSNVAVPVEWAPSIEGEL